MTSKAEDPELPYNSKTDHVKNASNKNTCEMCEKNDGRPLGDWRSTYSDCKFFLIAEGTYIILLLIFSGLLLFFAWKGSLLIWLDVENRDKEILPFLYAFSAGLIGGTLFTLKWLYHSVARKLWHLDRLMWRVFTPWMSAFFATIMYIMMTSGLISAFDKEALSSGSVSFSIGFLVGYFSDSAMSKFREIANTIFGTAQSS